MARVYAVASAKGGVGKTTTTANLAATLAAGGYDVAVVDGDIGMPNLGNQLGIEVAGPTLHDALSDRVDVEQATYEGPHGLSVVPGDPALTAFSEADATGLGRVVGGLADRDFVFVDTGAGISYDSALPLALCDQVILVSTADRDALGDTAKTRELAERLDAEVAGIVLTRVTPGTEPSDITGIDIPILGTVPEDPALAEATAAAVPITIHDPEAPSAAAYRDVAGHLADEEVEHPDVDEAAAAEAGAEAATTGADEPDEFEEELAQRQASVQDALRDQLEAEPDGDEEADEEGGAAVMERSDAAAEEFRESIRRGSDAEEGSAAEDIDLDEARSEWGGSDAEAADEVGAPPESAGTEPAGAEPAAAESPGTEPEEAEPAEVDGEEAEPAEAEVDGEAEAGETRTEEAEAGEAEAGEAGTEEAEAGEAEAGEAGTEEAEAGEAEAGEAGTEEAEAGEAEAGEAGTEEAEAGEAEAGEAGTEEAEAGEAEAGEGDATEVVIPEAEDGDEDEEARAPMVEEQPGEDDDDDDKKGFLSRLFR